MQKGKLRVEMMIDCSEFFSMPRQAWEMFVEGIRSEGGDVISLSDIGFEGFALIVEGSPLKKK